MAYKRGAQDFQYATDRDAAVLYTYHIFPANNLPCLFPSSVQMADFEGNEVTQFTHVNAIAIRDSVSRGAEETTMIFLGSSLANIFTILSLRVVPRTIRIVNNDECIFHLFLLFRISDIVHVLHHFITAGIGSDESAHFHVLDGDFFNPDAAVDHFG